MTGHGKVCPHFPFHRRRKSANLIDKEMHVTAGTIFIALNLDHMHDDTTRVKVNNVICKDSAILARSSLCIHCSARSNVYMFMK